MHRIVPEIVIENYRAGRRRGRFEAAALFVDISGFSVITDVLMHDRQAGAERLSVLMRSVFEPVVAAIFEHGGAIVGFAGDAITAVYPVTAGQVAAAHDALASAWSIQQRLSTLEALQTPYGTFPISAKIGVACGGVSWGILESRDRRRALHYFRGSAVEDSAEAEHHAEAGRIILARSASEWLSASVRCESRAGMLSVVGLRTALPPSHPIVQPPVDLKVARVFAPEVLLTQDLRGEFRQVVNLFVRIPDLADERLRALAVTLFDLQDRYAGYISRMDFGDKGCNLLMVWGAPTAYENDISRALSFAVDLRSTLDFPLAAGITFQMAHAGYVGSSLSEDYTCSGWGVNLAARFMMRAGPGDIWLDERMAQRGSAGFSVEYVGEQTFKGFAEQQAVYLLKDRRLETDSISAHALAGRDAEMRQLAEHMQPLWRGQFAGVTLILGEAGIGKSRLVREFRTSGPFEDREVMWAVCQADQIVRQSFNPFRHWLLRYFDLLSAADAAARLRSLDAVLDQLIQDIADEALIDDLLRARPFLAALVDLHWPDSPYELMDAQARYDNTLIALISLLKAESLRQPVIVLLEDAQDLDEDSKAFLPRLKRSLAAGLSYPIVILMTSRVEGNGIAIANPLADHVIELAGLTAEATASLSNDVLGRPSTPELIQFLTQRAEGNPFFAEQILHYLQDESLLELNGSGNWTLKPGSQLSDLPTDVNRILIARLDRLERDVKRVVQTASVLGREFETQVLSRMLKDDPGLENEVAEAERASIWSPLNELRYLFRHALLRDAAYSMQLMAYRRELHALALEALESLYAEELISHYPELAYHSEQASDREKARLYLRKAADSARDAYQNAQALDYYTRTLSLVAPEDLAERFQIMLERVLLHRRLGHRDAEVTDLDALDEMARRLDNPDANARVRMLRAKCVLNAGDFQQAVTYAAEAVDLAESAGAVDVALGAGLVLPEACLRQGKLEEAMHRAEQVLLFAQHHGRPAEQGAALNLMGLIGLEQKETSMARVFLESTLEIAQTCSDRALEAKSLNNLGNLAGFVQGDYATARDHYEEAYAIVHERGDRPAEAIALANLGWTAGMQGDLTAARAYQDRALSIAREIGDPYQEAYTLINLSAVAGMQGEPSAARQFAVEAEHLLSKIGDQSGRAWALLYKGNAYLAKKDLDLAQEAFQASVSIRDELKQPGLAAEPLAGLIQVALERPDITAARQWADVILSHLEAGGTLDGTEEPLRVYFACYRALEAQEDPRAQTVLRIARKMLAVQLSKFRDDSARRLYVESVPWRLGVQQAGDSGTEA